ncbi:MULTISPECIES: hypothetical protein [Nocardia]|uniref:hypothetical protein n=1 Tax=Nocardia TaxID=1817 RepID=UPI00030EA0FC|nr:MULTISPECIES: hypothetical protein [Nocardia]
MWIGYARSDLLSRHDADAFDRSVHEFAARNGFGDGRVYFEPLAAENVIGDLLTEIDHSVPVLNRLESLARGRRIDLTRLLAPPHRRADLLWSILSRIPEATDLRLLVPSRLHLSDLDPSGRAALSHLTALPTLTLHYLDATPHRSAPVPGPLPQHDAVSDHDAGREQVVVESRVGAIPAAAQLDAVEALTRNGWPEAIERVDAVYVALIGDRHHPPRSLWLEPTPLPDTVIRTLVDTATGALAVELDEPYPRSDEPSRDLVGVCEQVRRLPSGTHTITRCTLTARVSTTGQTGARMR